MTAGPPELGASIREEIEQVRATPGTLFHYTDIHGLYGIVESGSLLFSNAGFINDYTEVEHGTGRFRRRLEDELERSADPAVREVLSLALERIADPPGDIYIFSFSEEGDLLSQWRGYSRGPSAIAIGFESRRLPGELPGLARPVSLVYDDAAKDRLAAELVRSVLEEAGPGSDRLQTALKILGGARLLIPLFKSRSFHEEHEWRMVIPLSDRTPQYRIAGNFLLPFLPVRVPDFRETIREVVVGPSKDQVRVRQSLLHYFRTREITAGVRLSEVPLVS